MPRPSKAKRVCKLPECTQFVPAVSVTSPHRLLLSVEEYETIRLIDYLGYTQEECASQMEVGRATVQAVYAEARKKLGRFLVEGAALEIGGGSYRLCSESSCRQNPSCRGEMKGEQKMIIAVTYEDGNVFQHFGHTEVFKMYQVEDGKIVASELVSTNGSGHGALAGLLGMAGVNVLICGGIGGGARNALAEAGIELYPGACGNADAQVEAFLAGSLNYDPNTMCNHHGHGHSHEHGHSCGDHDHHCGGHCGS